MSIARRVTFYVIGWLIFMAIALVGFTYFRSQQALQEQAKASLVQSLAFFRNRLQAQEQAATLYAQQITLNDQVQQALLRGDRDMLQTAMDRINSQAGADIHIRYYHFYLPPGLFFLGNDTEHHHDISTQEQAAAEAALASGRIHTGLLIEHEDGLSIFSIVPVSYQGRIVGALEVSAPIDNATLQALTTYVPSDWQISLRADLAQENDVQPRIQSEDMPTEFLILQALSSYVPVYNTPDAYQEVFNDQIAIETIRQGGQIYTVLSAPIKSESNEIIGVLDIVQNNTKLLLTQFQTLVNVLLLTVAILSLGGLGITISINRSLSVLEEITEASRLVSQGKYETLPVPKRNDELSLLARTFNEMTRRVQDLVNNLDQRVKERTEALQRQAALLQATTDVGNVLATYRDVDEVLFQVVRRISDRFGFYHAGIFLIDKRREYAVLKAANSEGGQNMLARGHRLRVGQVGLVGYVAASGQARIALDVGQDAVYFDNPDLPETRSEMALPIIIQQEVVGVLDIQSRRANAFSENDIAVLQSLANQLAIAIENARLYEQAQEALKTAEQLLNRESQEAWSKLVKEREIAGFTSATNSGITPLDAPQLDDLQKQAIASKQSQISSDGLTLAVPIYVRQSLAGVLRLRKHPLMPAWDKTEVQMVNTLMEQFSAAIENARLYSETRRRAMVERAIDEIASRLSIAADIESILRETAHALGQYMSDAEVVVKMTNPGEGE